MRQFRHSSWNLKSTACVGDTSHVFDPATTSTLRNVSQKIALSTDSSRVVDKNKMNEVNNNAHYPSTFSIQSFPNKTPDTNAKIHMSTIFCC